MLDLIGDRVAVRLDEANKTSKGGILLPNEKRPLRGKVVYSGQTTRIFTAGDRVVFEPFVGIDIEDGEDKLVVLKEENIIARILR